MERAEPGGHGGERTDASRHMDCGRLVAHECRLLATLPHLKIYLPSAASQLSGSAYPYQRGHRVVDIGFQVHGGRLSPRIATWHRRLGYPGNVETYPRTVPHAGRRLERGARGSIPAWCSVRRPQ